MAWLNYHHLLYFWTVARTGSVSAAAKELRLAHPTVSAQIHTLEQNLGHKLFRQRGRRLELTESGQLAYRFANDIFALGGEMVQALSGQPSPGVLRLRVGVTDVLPKPIAYRFLEPVVGDASVRVVCYEGKPNGLLRKLALNELDLVLSDFPVAPQFGADMVTRLLGESDVQLFGRARLVSKYARGFPQSLDGAPFLLPTENTAMRRLMNQWFASRRIRPQIVAEYEDSELLKEHGATGAGLFPASSMMERHTKQHYGARLLGPLEGAQIRYYAIAMESRLKHPAVRRIIEAARRIFV